MKFEANKSSNRGEHFITLKDGDSATGVLVGDPLVFHTHWVGARSQLCTGPTTCDQCKGGAKQTFRFRLNMIVAGDNGKPVAKVLEQGYKLYCQLDAINAEVPLEGIYLKIKRTGQSKNDTIYTALQANKVMTADTKRALTDIKLLPLNPNDDFWKAVPANDTASEVNAEEEVPF